MSSPQGQAFTIPIKKTFAYFYEGVNEFLPRGLDTYTLQTGFRGHSFDFCSESFLIQKKHFFFTEEKAYHFYQLSSHAGVPRVFSIAVDMYHALCLILYYLLIDSYEVLGKNSNPMRINTTVICKLCFYSNRSIKKWNITAMIQGLKMHIHRYSVVKSYVYIQVKVCRAMTQMPRAQC